MKIGYFIEGAYDKLFDIMESSRDKYKMKTPWIKDYFRDTEFFVETNNEFPPFKLINTGDKTKDDFQNTVTLYNALGFLDAVEEFIKDGNDFTEDIERQTIKFVNRYGGVVVIDVLSRTELKKLVYDYMKKKSRNDKE